LIFFKSPVMMARSITTIDILSQGRVLIGLGIEHIRKNIWFQIYYFNNEERADEYLNLLKRIWMDDLVEFDGKFYSVPSSIIGPKPYRNLVFLYIRRI